MGTGGCVVAAKSVKEAASVSIDDNAITARSVEVTSYDGTGGNAIIARSVAHLLSRASVKH